MVKMCKIWSEFGLRGDLVLKAEVDQK